MNPKVKQRSPANDEYLGRLIHAIESFDCKGYFSDHLGQSQSRQKVIVAKFQRDLCGRLKQDLPDTNWKTEHSPNASRRDSIDIFGESQESVVAIELDKHRADQVAKKFVSRVALLPERKVYFISLCYPGTVNMNISECKKYFSYCANLSKRMGNAYAGFIIESET